MATTITLKDNELTALWNILDIMIGDREENLAIDDMNGEDYFTRQYEAIDNIIQKLVIEENVKKYVAEYPQAPKAHIRKVVKEAILARNEEG